MMWNWIVLLLGILLLVLEAADVLTTRVDMVRYHTVESNPVMVLLIRYVGFWLAMAIKMGVVIAAALFAVLHLAPPIDVIALALACAGQGWVVWHNWRLMRPI